MPNPLLQLPNQMAGDPFYMMDLSGGLEAVLQNGNAKRRRYEFRRRLKTAEQMGGYEFVIPKSTADINKALDDFFIQKSARFKQLGVKDVFSDDNIQRFVRCLATQQSINNEPLLKLMELKVGGKTRALYAGASANNVHFQAWFNSVTYDDFAEHSPGDMILTPMIEYLVSQGYQSMDFGVGKERYKQSWCQSHDNQFHTVLPLSMISVPIVEIMKLKTMLRDRIRNDDRIWPHVKNARKRLSSLIA
jgi:CelD/BcsL family acetyltransferase involved in cellulose biosynthesis